MRTIVLFSLLGALVGCGGPHGDPGPISSAKFVGNWVYASGTSTTTCSGMAPMSSDQTGKKLTFAAGTDSDLVVTDGNSCKIKFSISGDTASVLPSQKCDFTQTQGGVTVVSSLSLTTATFSTTDGTTMTMADSGMSVSNIGGFMLSCAATGSGTLTKSP